MHRDPSLRTRNALVIPGVLLVLLALVGIAYAQVLRGDDVECGDGSQVVLAGACRSATLILVIPLAIGVLLLGLGAAKRSKVTCRIGHGTAATTMLAVLIALVAIPLLAAGAILMMETADQPYLITYQDIDFSLGDILAAVGLVMLLPLVPYLVLYLATMRPPRCCRERSCFEPCFCDESEPEGLPPAPPPQIEEVPGPVAPVGDAPMAPNETAVVTSSPWTGSSHVQPLPTPPPRPARVVAWTPPPEVPAPAPEPVPAPPVMAETPAEETEAEPVLPEPKTKATRKAAAPKTRKVTRKSKSGK